MQSRINYSQAVQTNKNIMKSGEGKANIKAGTSNVPTVVRNNSRRIKNSL